MDTGSSSHENFRTPLDLDFGDKQTQQNCHLDLTFPLDHKFDIFDAHKQGGIVWLRKL